ncbi:chaperone protein DnaJ [Rubrobacter radiotolerans]|uniref:Chaperone protein DnaJ n=1 Tax=Rubrobacter radiotolerans TaxID=42256 RepID=A0A023X0D9_RUBRA|nr:molecular chaperone DnaJ [Rubrobacter radiotolerans]AHY45942.1 chaperone protein DnaJ [Rubrobacter radiotolerans]MDX5893356.1 molecular chaperone DnaJ [Rubrobacter radiotolerans]SMC03560.1 molecular chaperone DnaJ [Rubrobacter radiotolerans DSM 5868]
METKDLYKTLGVGKDASREEIRGAYRRLARKYHPDANPDDPAAEERFKEIQNAYEVLSNPERRREYDRGPETFFGQGGFRDGGRPDDLSDFADLFGNFGGFGDIFGRSTSARTNVKQRGDDVTVSVNLKFNESLNGVTTRVRVVAEEVCGDCGGSGASPGTAIRTCPDCGGRGTRSRDQGFFALSETCPRCRGEGVYVEKPCSSCAGTGRVERPRQVTVRIPAGAKDGTKVRVPGRGSAGRKGGPPGDLYVVTRVEEHPVFKRRGDDFVVEVPVSFVEAALGAEVPVPRPGGGRVRLKLPAGTQHGRQLKVRGAGAPNVKKKGQTGDLIVKVSVVVPKKLTRREREILEAFAEERDEDVREGLFREASGT